MNKLETGGIELLGKERPDLLIRICQDNFLPPTQMIMALKALEWYPDKQSLLENLAELLEHMSNSVVEQAAITMGVERTNEAG
jgi:hypothetical protein